MPRPRRFSCCSSFGCFLTALGIGLANSAPVPIANAQVGLDLECVVRTTLDRNTSILRSIESVHIHEANLQVIAGAFDTIVGFSAEGGRTSRLYTNSEQSVFDVSSAYTGTSSYRLAAARLTRMGLTISPAIELARRDALTLDTPPILQTKAALQLSYPLLMAGKRSPQVADVASAEHALQAGAYDVTHARAESIYRVVVTYWAYLSAFESLKIHEASEAKAHRLLEETRALVEGGERASSDLDQLRADLADRFAARIAAEQRLVESRHRLGMEMGLRADEADALPHPSSGFPPRHGLQETQSLAAYDALASSRRADLAGTRKTVDAEADARYARGIEALPKLDLRFSIGYAGLSENRLTLEQHLPPFGQNHVSGANGSISLVLEWPVSNRRAHGRLQRQHAAWRQAQLTHKDLERRIRSGVRVATEQLRSTVAELGKVEEAVTLYKAAVENERKKLQLGMSTQFDLILVEERLRNSQLSRVAARARYSGAIVRLKFETGTLFADGDTAFKVANRLLYPTIEVD